MSFCESFDVSEFCNVLQQFVFVCHITELVRSVASVSAFNCAYTACLCMSLAAIYSS